MEFIFRDKCIKWIDLIIYILMLLLPFLYEISLVYKIIFELIVIAFILYESIKVRRIYTTKYFLENNKITVFESGIERIYYLDDIESLIEKEIEEIHLKYGIKTRFQDEILFKDDSTIKFYRQLTNKDSKTLIEFLHCEYKFEKIKELETNKSGCLVEIAIILAFLLVLIFHIK